MSHHRSKQDSGYESRSSRFNAKSHFDDKSHFERFWYCCACDLSGPGAISLWTDHCPLCYIQRCENCRRERVKVQERGRAVASGMITSLESPPLRFTSWHEVGYPGDESAKERKLYHEDIPLNKSLCDMSMESTTNTNYTPSMSKDSAAMNVSHPLHISATAQLSPSMPDESMSSRTRMSLVNAPLHPADVRTSETSAESSPISHISSPRSRDNGKSPGTVSDTEWDTESEWTDEDNETDPVNALDRATMEKLDDCILASCHQNLVLAARLIPIIHTIVSNWIRSGDDICTTRPNSEDNTSYTGSTGDGSLANKGRSSQSHSQKRPGEADDGDSPGRPTKKQRRRPDNEIGPHDPIADSPAFACHFCKKAPQRYNSQVSRKYANCANVRIPINELRRIKDHFKNHRLSQCDRCYTTFASDEALVAHRQSSNVCELADQFSTLKEGIDDGEWERIVRILKKRGDKGKSDYEKWYEIWTVLFPSTARPDTPWNDFVTLPRIQSPSTDVIMRDIISEVQNSIDQGVIPPNDQLYGHIFTIVQRRLETESTGLLNIDPVPTVTVNDAMYNSPPESIVASRHQDLTDAANPASTFNDVSLYTSFNDIASTISAGQTPQLDITTLHIDAPNSQIFRNEDIGGQSSSSTLDTIPAELPNLRSSPHHEHNQTPQTLETVNNDSTSRQISSLDEDDQFNFDQYIDNWYDGNAILTQNQQQTDIFEDGNIELASDIVASTPTDDWQRDMGVDFEMLEREVESLDPTQPFTKKDRNTGLEGRYSYNNDGTASVYP